MGPMGGFTNRKKIIPVAAAAPTWSAFQSSFIQHSSRNGNSDWIGYWDHQASVSEPVSWGSDCLARVVQQFSIAYCSCCDTIASSKVDWVELRGRERERERVYRLVVVVVIDGK